MTAPKIIKELRDAAFERQKGLCHWCGAEMIPMTSETAPQFWNHPRVCTAERVLWRSRGGKNTPENIVAACRDCNNRRHPPPDLAAEAAARRERRGEFDWNWPWLIELTLWSRRNSIGCADFFALPYSDMPPTKE